jgi:putative ABC transport system ATP-binding protein
MNVGPALPDDELDGPEEGALTVLRRGIAQTPELKRGLFVSVLFALMVAGGNLVIPIAIQQILDKGVSSGDPDWSFVVKTCVGAAVAMVLLAGLNKFLYQRLMRTAATVIYSLRVRTFAHVHELSIRHHGESRRGVLVARVTSDLETLAQFASWGAVSWVVNATMIVDRKSVV